MLEEGCVERLQAMQRSPKDEQGARAFKTKWVLTAAPSADSQHRKADCSPWQAPFLQNGQPASHKPIHLRLWGLSAFGWAPDTQQVLHLPSDSVSLTGHKPLRFQGGLVTSP